jgi:hypothetical protein
VLEWTRQRSARSRGFLCVKSTLNRLEASKTKLNTLLSCTIRSLTMGIGGQDREVNRLQHKVRWA